MRNTTRNRPKSATRQARLGVSPQEVKGWTPYFRIKKPVLPKVKITKPEEGEMKITVSRKVKPGIYELVLNGNDRQQMVVTKIQVV